MKNDSFIYSALKYVHSESSGESINIGILLFWPQNGNFYFGYSQDLYRIKHLYDLKSEKILKEYLKNIDKKCKKVSNVHDLFIEFELEDMNDFINKNIYIKDSSALQFDTAIKCNNYFSDPLKVLEFLKHQYFINKGSKVENKSHARNKPESILHKFETNLSLLGLYELEGVENKIIKNYEITNETGNIIKFDIAWQNGHLNLVKPINFDLSNNKNIVEKAYFNFGQFSDLEEEAKQNNLCYNLLIDKPSNADFYREYDHAVNLLTRLEKVKIVTDENLDSYSSYMYNQIKQDLTSL